MTKTNKNTLKNVWKKPLAGLLSLSILAGISTSCLAKEKHEQGANERQIDVITSQSTKTEIEERSNKKSAIEKPTNLCSQMINHLQSSQHHKKLGLTKEEAKVIKQLSLRMQKRLNEYLIINDIQSIEGYEGLSLFSKLYKEQQNNISEQDKKYLESYHKKEEKYLTYLFGLK